MILIFKDDFKKNKKEEYNLSPSNNQINIRLNIPITDKHCHIKFMQLFDTFWTMKLCFKIYFTFEYHV